MVDNIKLSRPGLAIDPVHDGRHDLGGRPLGRESIPYLLNLPEEGVALFTYTWVDSASKAGAALAIFGPGVPGGVIQQGFPDRPVSSSMNFDDWRIEGFSMQQDLAFKKAHICWENEAAKVEFDYEAMHPPYAYGANAAGCPPYVADNRIEQSGRVTGTLRFAGGRTVSFDSTGHRDHSWGTRDWRAMQFYHWFHGQTSDGTCVHFWRLLGLGKTTVYGYIAKDGILAEVTSVENLDVSTDKALTQKSYTFTAVDELGRRVAVSAEVFASYVLKPDPEFFLNEGAGKAVIDGKPGVGWLEMGWPSAYLQHIANVGGY